MTYENIRDSISLSVNKVLLEYISEHIGTHLLHIIYGCFPSNAALLTSGKETIWSAKLEIFIICSFTETFC